ncbi:acetyl-CoA C-acetyltransferase [Gammaproteobacteria bacterium]|nr:acetyl-CoA C-acetyltransferase [Gammaproteobacteria bacterium]
MSELKRVAIVAANRIPFCRANSGYSGVTNQQMLEATLNGLVDRAGLAGMRLDEVVGGAVINHTRDFGLVRESVLSTSLDSNTPGIFLQQACGTSLQAALTVAAKISCGQIENGIACGVDTISDAPLTVGRKLAGRLKTVAAARSFGDKVKAFKGFSPKELAPIPPGVEEPRTGLSMGQHAELMARTWGITREAQDEVAIASHQNAARAWQEGFHDPLVSFFHGVAMDNNIRADIEPGKVGELKPAFDRRSGHGSLTAANSTPLTDGASAVFLASEEWAKAHDMPILCYLTAGAHSAVDFVGGEGLLIAPATAVKRVLDQRGLGLQDFDCYELHEAFAAQMLSVLAAWEDADFCKKHFDSAPLGSIDRSRLNVNGSSIAYGHPFAATGGRLLGHSARLLETRGGGRALLGVCTAGGMGVAAILESA